MTSEPAPPTAEGIAKGPPVDDKLDIVFFWKQNDTGIYGRHQDMLVKYCDVLRPAASARSNWIDAGVVGRGDSANGVVDGQVAKRVTAAASGGNQGCRAARTTQRVNFKRQADRFSVRSPRDATRASPTDLVGRSRVR